MKNVGVPDTSLRSAESMSSATRAAQRDQQGGYHDALGVGECDHPERDDVVDDEDREHEGTQANLNARTHEGEDPERQRGIRRHRRAPTGR